MSSNSVAAFRAYKGNAQSEKQTVVGMLCNATPDVQIKLNYIDKIANTQRYPKSKVHSSYSTH